MRDDRVVLETVEMIEGRASHDRVIEFIGLPGCGKTTVAKHILSLANEVSPRITNGSARAYSRKQTMLFAVRKFVPCVKVFFYLSVYVLVRPPNASMWDHVRRIRAFYKVYCGMLFSFFRRVSDTHAAGEMILFEHGPINVFWMIDLGHGSRGKLRRKVLQTIQRNFKVEYVYFDIPAATAARRVTAASGREQTPFDRMGEAERRAVFEKNAERFPSLLRILEQGGANCLVVDAESRVEEKATTILSWLERTSDRAAEVAS